MFSTALRSRRLLLLLLAGLLGVGILIWWWTRPDPGDENLRQFVQARPPVPVVFTSRTEPASFQAAAPAGPVYTFPGQLLWHARQGRLRLLTPQGTVHELTWNRPLPDGSTLIDVMSPSVSLDGRKIVFAGRRGGDDPGHFRLYEVGLDGRNLRQLTGLPEDAGCLVAPPLRYREPADTAWFERTMILALLPLPGLPVNLALGALSRPPLIPDPERRRIDYDDVDPIFLPEGRLAFISTRIPDLGRGHARRASHLWLRMPNGQMRPASANRNNDRWPFLTARGVIAFSMWSRNTEVVTADLSNLVPYAPGLDCANRPTDLWQGVAVEPNGGRFSMLLKLNQPVWRPRPLFNGKLAFMTASPVNAAVNHTAPDVLAVAQAAPNLITQAPSSLPVGEELPRSEIDHLLWRGPTHDASGRRLSLATPSPCPPDRILLAGATFREAEKRPPPGRYGIYLAAEDWQPARGQPADAAAIELQLLFDDPDLVDAEPVAVYPRPITGNLADVEMFPSPLDYVPQLKHSYPLAGAPGQVQSGGVYHPSNTLHLVGQKSDAGEGPIFAEPPQGSMDHVRFYVSHRDRFDDPLVPRLPGPWEELSRVPLTSGQDALTAWIPSGVPTVLAGFNKQGKVVRWTMTARDKQGRRATFLAVAGDHYSGIRPHGMTFCTGCHPGHSVLDFPSYPEPR